MLFALIMIIALLLPSGSAAADPADDALLERIKALELQARTSGADSVAELEQIFSGLDRNRMPKSWIRAYSLLIDSHPNMVSDAELDRMQKAAEDKQDMDSVFRILGLKLDNAWRAQDTQNLAELFNQVHARSCADRRHQFWCGYFWREEAYYRYQTGETAQGIEAIQKSIQLLRDQTGPDRYYYYLARQTFGLLLTQDKKHEESARIEQENIAWFESQGYLHEAVNASYNVASVLLSMSNFDAALTESFVRKYEELSRATKDASTIARYYHLLGNFQRKMGKFAEAIEAYTTAHDRFKAIGNTMPAARAELQKSKVYVLMQNPRKAEEAVARFYQLMPVPSDLEYMNIMPVREDIARQKGDYKAAWQILKEYQKFLEERQTAEATANMQRLSTQLGLAMEKERNLQLSHQVERQQQEIKEAERLKIFLVVLGTLTVTTLLFAGLAFRAKRLANISRAKLQQVLDHVDLGLLTIDRHLQIDANHSRHLQTIVQQETPLPGSDFNRSILEKSLLNSEEKSITQEILCSVFDEKSLAWDLNAANLPNEIALLQERIHNYTLRWIPIFNQHDILKKILLIMTDVTHEKELSKALDDQEQMLKDLPNILQKLRLAPPAQLKRFLHDMSELLHSQEAGDSLLRKVHTQKGVARVLGLSPLSALIHEWESELKASGRNEGTECREALAHQLQAHESIADTLYQQGKDYGPDASPLQILDASLRACAQRLANEGMQLAEISFVDGVIVWSPEDLTLLRDFLVHGLTNSIDHGYVFPQKRGRSPEAPRIRVAAQRNQDRLQLEIVDEGAGLCEESIQNLAKAKGFQPGPHEKVFDVLFWDGISTAEVLTQTSGRGVGLAALKVQITARQGQIHIEQGPKGRGTRLWAEWQGASGTQTVQRCS